jgi:glycosyltransferase involved in cell wall biosynthesis
MRAPSSASPRSSSSPGRARLDARPLISVVVPTRDRPRALGRCLEALSAQTAIERLEVVVVDDGSVDGDAVAETVSRWPGARLRRQASSGPAAARNAGAHAARGRFICFTDDDCEPHEDWAERLVEALESTADAVGGRTIGAPSDAIVRASELIAHAPALVSASEDSLVFTPSNNLACRADVLAAVPFDERYPAAAGEDREWCDRLLRSGRVLRYEPAAVLVHHHDSDIRSFLRKQFRYGRGAFRFRRLGPEPRSLEQPWFYARLVRRGFAEGPIAGTLVCVAQLTTAVGFAAEWAKTRREGRTSAG